MASRGAPPLHPLGPSAQPLTPLGPSAQPLRPLGPSAQPLTPLGPSAQPVGLGRPVLRLRWDHVGLRGWPGPGRGGVNTGVNRHRPRRSAGRRDARDVRSGHSARFLGLFLAHEGDARSLRAVGLEDTSRGQKKRGFPRVRTEEDGTLFFPRKSVERGRFGLGFRV